MHDIGPVVLLSVLVACGPQPFYRDGPLTNWPGPESAPSFSPDGKYIVFDATVDGNTDIYVLSLQSREVRRLTTSASVERRPAWAPDGDWISYFSNQGGANAIWISDVQGAKARKIHEPLAGLYISGVPRWSPDGTKIAFTLLDPEGVGSPTWGRATVAVVNSDGSGDSTSLTGRGDEWWPSWSADGAWLYYYTGELDHIEAVETSTREVKSISGKRYRGWRPSPSPDNRSILFGAALEDWGIWIAPLDNSVAPVRITRGGFDDLASFSPDGKWIVFSRRSSESEIATLDLETGERKTVRSNARDPNPFGNDKIAFLTRGHDTWDIRTLDLPTGEERRLLADVSPVGDIATSSEGQFIAANRREFHDGAEHIFILDSEGNSTGVSATPFRAEFPVFCDDGDTVVFRSPDTEIEGLHQIWSLSIKDAQIEQLSHEEFSIYPTQCQMSRGRIVFALTLGRTGTGSLSKSDSGWTSGDIMPGHSGKYSPDGRLFAYLDNVDGQTDIFIRDAEGNVRRLTDDALVEDTLHWIRNGRALLFDASQANQNIWLSKVPEQAW